MANGIAPGTNGITHGTNGDTLLNCPFCGGEASVKVMEYDDDCKVWGVFCESDLESEYGHGHFLDNFATEAEAIAAWNTRTPEQTITATLGGGAVTSEQLRKAIARHGAMLRGCVWQIQDASCDVIADELNAAMETGKAVKR